MSILPNQLRSIQPNDPWGTKCENHPEIDAVTKVCAEADSFGEEYLVFCQECLDKHRADEKTREETQTGHCDRCKATPLLKDMYHYRDIDEGSHGPVYHVCESCYDRYQARLSEEGDY